MLDITQAEAVEQQGADLETSQQELQQDVLQQQIQEETALVGTPKESGALVIIIATGQNLVVFALMFQNALNQEHHHNNQAAVAPIGERADISAAVIIHRLPISANARRGPVLDC
jgi:hypothetical protein